MESARNTLQLLTCVCVIAICSRIAGASNVVPVPALASISANSVSGSPDGNYMYVAAGPATYTQPFRLLIYSTQASNVSEWTLVTTLQAPASTIGLGANVGYVYAGNSIVVWIYNPPADAWIITVGTWAVTPSQSVNNNIQTPDLVTFSSTCFMASGGATWCAPSWTAVTACPTYGAVTQNSIAVCANPSANQGTGLVQLGTLSAAGVFSPTSTYPLPNVPIGAQPPQMGYTGVYIFDTYVFVPASYFAVIYTYTDTTFSTLSTTVILDASPGNFKGNVFTTDYIMYNAVTYYRYEQGVNQWAMIGHLAVSASSIQAINTPAPYVAAGTRLYAVGCNPGLYAPTQLPCTPCPTNTFNAVYGANNIAQCLPCAAGTSTNGATGASSCAPCAAGYWSASGSNCTGCSPGFFSTALGATSSAVCQACQAGTFSSINGASFCSLCGAGSTSGAQAISCTECPAGSSCPGGTAAAPCQAGTYSALNSTTCSACATGFYSATDAPACAICPAGFVCLVANAPPYPCSTGTYSSGTGLTALAQCVSCPPGTWSNALNASTVSACVSCQAGTWSNAHGAASVDTCTSCLPGTYSGTVGSGAPCGSCPAGTYANVTGASSSQACTPCPLGSYSTDAGASSLSVCTQCAAGSYASNAQPGASSSSVCAACGPGTYSSVTGATSPAICTPCAVGSYNPTSGASSSQSCLQCDAGTFATNMVPGAGSASVCSACPAGTYSTSIGATSSAACLPCPAGTYSFSPGAVSVLFCMPCPSGTYGPNPGAASSQQCHSCAQGTASIAIGAWNVSTCSACAVGTYAVSPGTTSCQLCGAGSYANAVGMAACATCAVGSYSTQTGASTPGVCLLCEPGTFSTAAGASSADTCFSCTAGTFSEIAGSTSCPSCPPGTWLAASGASSSSACQPCQAGTYSTSFGATSADTCIPCNAGYYSTTVGAISASVCLLCTDVFSAVTGATSCRGCPSGQYAVRDSQGNLHCATCGPGTFSAGNTSCIPCPIGTYGTSSGASACAACTAGQFTLATGQSSSSQCVPCAAGSYCPGGSAYQCPAGTYSATISATSVQNCLSCPSGTFGVAAGASSLASCQLCPAGTFNNLTAQFTAASCLPCGSGYFSAVIGAMEQATCQLCAPGTYNNVSAAAACVPCPAGTYSARGGASAQVSCLLCPPGSASPTAGATMCSNCTTGYCPPGAVGPLALQWGNTATASTVEQRASIDLQVAADNAEKTRTLELIVIGSGAAVIIAVIIILVVTVVRGHRHAGTMTSAFQRADFFFATKHMALPGHPVVHQRTVAGGLFSLSFFLCVTLLIAVLVLQFVFYNTVVSNTIVAGDAPNPGASMLAVSGTATLVGYTGACSATAATVTFNGFTNPQGAQFTNAFRVNGTNCQVNFSCAKCTVQAESTINVTVTEPQASAAVITWALQYTEVIPGETNVVSGTAAPAMPEALFRGAQPTTVLVAVVPTLYRTLNDTKVSGYQIFNGSIVLGSQTSAQTFFATESSVLLVLDLTPYIAGYSLVAESYASSWVDLLVRLLSLTAGLFSAFGITLAAWEFILYLLSGMTSNSGRNRALSSASWRERTNSSRSFTDAHAAAHKSKGTSGGSTMSIPLIEMGSYGADSEATVGEPVEDDVDEHRLANYSELRSEVIRLRKGVAALQATTPKSQH
eukprot:TRINITY_DN9750_c0_g1_i1.p1 TRINITY_DN9750_c0_g1~~TRINITY_DN9750_c0_g1_i1.p1  ORF type:complete len:1668 (-),score=218.68 TRINITY_DN9750_c0_g1_i1:11-5014(-)